MGGSTPPPPPLPTSKAGAGPQSTTPTTTCDAGFAPEGEDLMVFPGKGGDPVPSIDDKKGGSNDGDGKKSAAAGSSTATSSASGGDNTTPDEKAEEAAPEPEPCVCEGEEVKKMSKISLKTCKKAQDEKYCQDRCAPACRWDASKLLQAESASASSSSAATTSTTTAAPATAASDSSMQRQKYPGLKNPDEKMSHTVFRGDGRSPKCLFMSGGFNSYRGGDDGAKIVNEKGASIETICRAHVSNGNPAFVSFSKQFKGASHLTGAAYRYKIQLPKGFEHATGFKEGRSKMNKCEVWKDADGNIALQQPDGTNEITMATPVPFSWITHYARQEDPVNVWRPMSEAKAEGEADRKKCKLKAPWKSSNAPPSKADCKKYESYGGPFDAI